MNVMLKRAYEPPARTDGTRILVDRLWPHGVAKVKARLDHWLKDNSALSELHTLSQRGNITLLYAARDESHNEAVLLKQILDRRNRKAE